MENIEIGRELCGPSIYKCLFGHVARLVSPLSQISPSLTSPTASCSPQRAARGARSGRPTGLDVPVAAGTPQAARSVAGAVKPGVAHLGLHVTLHSSRSSAGKRPLPRYASPPPVCFRCRASIPLVCIQKHPKTMSAMPVGRSCCPGFAVVLYSHTSRFAHFARPRPPSDTAPTCQMI